MPAAVLDVIHMQYDLEAKQARQLATMGKGNTFLIHTMKECKHSLLSPDEESITLETIAPWVETSSHHLIWTDLRDCRGEWYPRIYAKH